MVELCLDLILRMCIVYNLIIAFREFMQQNFSQ